jgi:hypothetical protein
MFGLTPLFCTVYALPRRSGGEFPATKVLAESNAHGFSR